MKIVLADGGVGNQLFQLSFALYLSESTNSNVTVDIDGGLHNHGVAGLADLIAALGLEIYTGPRPKLKTQLALAQRTISTWKFGSPFLGMQSHIRLGSSQIYCGYWQNVSALNTHYGRVADVCCELFDLQPRNSTCMHVRLGDYQNSKNRRIYSQIDSEYYYKSLRYLRQNTHVETINVLTNDEAGARKMLSAPEFAPFEFKIGAGTALADFTAICESSSIIATNSTFCWWAAFISARMKGLKHLVAPEDWFNPGYRHRQAPSYSMLQNQAGHEISFMSI